VVKRIVLFVAIGALVALSAAQAGAAPRPRAATAPSSSVTFDSSQITLAGDGTTVYVNCRKHDLQDAIDSAQPGDRLKIGGVCYGNFVIDKDLELIGQRSLWGNASVLDAQGYGTVLFISGGTVELERLTIRNGLSATGGEFTTTAARSR
jgi:hypothetical protein